MVDYRVKENNGKRVNCSDLSERLNRTITIERSEDDLGKTYSYDSGEIIVQGRDEQDAFVIIEPRRIGVFSSGIGSEIRNLQKIITSLGFKLEEIGVLN